MTRKSKLILTILMGGATAMVAPATLSAQLQTSLGVGLAIPVGDFGDAFERGYTVRGQVGLSMIAVGVHAQAGWSRFPAIQQGDIELADADIYHLVAGARFGLGPLWVGGNGGYFYGDDDQEGIAFFPEVGAGLGPLEAVADLRVGGDARWLGLRVALRF